MTITPQLTAAAIAFAWSYLTLMALVTGLVKRWRRRRAEARDAAAWRTPRSCLLVRPCAGDEPSLFEALTSVTQAGRSFSLTVRFGVDSPDDGAMSAIEQAVEQLRDAGIDADCRVVPATGPNRKTAILAGCVGDVADTVDAVICADSNVDLTGFDLTQLVCPLLTAGNSVGAVWSPFYERSDADGLGNRASEAVLNASWHSFGLLSAIDPGGMVGKLFAIRPDALRRIGGFEGLVTFLGEDMEMMRRLRGEGYAPTATRTATRAVVGVKSWSETIARHQRWMMVVKAQRPALLFSYPLLFFSTLLILPVSLFAMSGNALVGGAVTGFTLLTRWAVGAVAGRLLGLGPKWRHLPVDALLADITLLIAFVKTLFTSTFYWRGHPLSIGPDGRLMDDGAR